MTRPALVIGLGGTGQWVLTFLKKELLEIGGGTLPPGVKLLAFDTTSQPTAGTGQAGKRAGEDAVLAGSVQLTQGIEFIPIGDNVGTLAAEIANGRHQYLQWYPAKSYLAKLPPAAFNTKEGSGQIRQMGRISLFRDLSSVHTSQILTRLRASLQALQRSVSRDAQLEVIIVGSLAGGTGAGLLIDLALLLRAQASRLVQDNYLVRGFFVLPRAFTSVGIGEGRDMLARSFAAWRELDRFMIVSERFGLRQINYHDQNQDLRIQLNKRAYDVSYMVDPARQSVNSLDSTRPEEGLYPALAHCISAILDDKAGKAYTEFVSTNLAGKLSNLPRRPYHSAIGSYTLKVPVYYAREKFSHQLAMEALTHFLAPDINERGRVTRLSELRNREVPDGYAGRRAVLSFMGASALNIGGQEIPNTGLLPLMAEIREKEAQREAAIINQWARGGLSTVRNRVLAAMTDISQDEEGKLILRNITDLLQRPIWTDVAPSRVVGDTPDQAFSRMNKIEDIRHEYYGVDSVAGERLRGKYGKALEEARRAQRARFRKLLQAQTLHMLNGQSEDPMIARSGKLGYVLAFYEALAETLGYFIGFLDKVRQERNENLKLASTSREAARRSKLHYGQIRGKGCPFTFWDNFVHPEAHQAQRNYLLAEQRSIEVRKDDILLDVLAESAAEMKALAEATRDDVASWISHLATGGPNTTSLFEAAAESLANVNVNHELDKRLSKVSEIVGEHQYHSEPSFVADALRSLGWQVEQGSDRLRLVCGVSQPAADGEGQPRFEPFRREGDKPSQHNLDRLIKLAERPYRRLHQERPLAREVARVYPTGSNLADAVHDKATPLYKKSATETGPEVIACYIRVHSDLDDTTTAYFDGFEDQMRQRMPFKDSSLTLVDSEDPHKLTIVQSYDLLPSTDFEMWEACRAAYIAQVTDPYKGVQAAELHIFPAEINACYYESQMPVLLLQPFRTLHPEVVSLLEDRERFAMFFRAKALGFIRREESQRQPYWVYQLPGHDEPMFLTVPVQDMAARREDDMFQLIHNFAMEGRDQRPGVGQALIVDWGELREAIFNKQYELGDGPAADLYRAELEDKQGIVAQIGAIVSRQRATERDPQLRNRIGQEYDDLMDAARVVYKQAIESL